jgi:UDP-2,3-diacylglucosamine pyrophosphatase LpxH
VYVPGNHDEAARQFCGLSFGGVQMAKEASHVTADGRRLLVTHGDQFDLVVRNSRLLALAGTVGYEMLLKINGVYNFGRRLFGLPYDSLSQAIKARVKSACNFISNFEQALVAEARAGGFDGVVCGHIHKAEQRRIGDLEYLNCGDWVESCTALVEHDDGRIELLDGLAFLAARDTVKEAIQENGDESEETDPWLARGFALDGRIFLTGDGK